MTLGLHITERDRTHDREMFLRLRDVAGRNGFNIGERQWPTVARLVRQRLGPTLYKRCDDYTLVSVLTGIKGTNPMLFAPPLFGPDSD